MRVDYKVSWVQVLIYSCERGLKFSFQKWGVMSPFSFSEFMKKFRFSKSECEILIIGRGLVFSSTLRALPKDSFALFNGSDLNFLAKFMFLFLFKPKQMSLINCSRSSCFNDPLSLLNNSKQIFWTLSDSEDRCDLLRTPL